jgi:exosortase
MSGRNPQRRRLDRDALQRSRHSSQASALDQPSAVPAARPVAAGKPALRKIDWLAAMLVVGIAFALGFWPTLVELVSVWQRQPDYSHGFLVAPIALFVLWLRRDRLPRGVEPPGWAGMAMVVVSVAVAVVGARYFLAPLAGWSMVLWIAGVGWVLGGRQLFLWALPAILFLFFMVPLPYRAELWLSGPLQSSATTLSTWILQSLGLPAVAAGNTIQLGDYRIEVEQSCSGLRTLVGIAALVYVFIVATRRSVWTKALLVLSAIPVSLAANSLRIVATGLLGQLSDPAAKPLSHDAAGWLTMPIAAVLLWGVLWFLGRVLVEAQPASGPELLGRIRDLSPDPTKVDPDGLARA